ncbi:hypothetical protein FKW77_010896 [Venturia effusa]|uniref:Transcriptional regulatory protein DEP1 n=1 Tax=Venturia effusa TaxID=50376 RepID=A0A517KYR8_9PEZI|nr:hypothetical protein FKW77_010896 [Venturia effusa]
MQRSKSRSADPNYSSSLTNQVAHTSPKPRPQTSNEAEPERSATQSPNQSYNETMISTITRKQVLSSIEPMSSRRSADVADRETDTFDTRSSSLSDLDDTNEDRSADLVSKLQAESNDDEFDSEAETERLEKTPRKANASRNNNNSAQNGVEKTPSKLAHEMILDGTDEVPVRATGSPISLIPSPITPVQEIAHLDRPAGSERDSESPSRKRKRSISATSSLSEADIPLAKRVNSTKYNLEALAPSTESLDLPQDYGNGAMEEGIMPDEPVVNRAEHAEEELDAAPAERTAPVKGKKGGKKGKRKGKKGNNGNDSEAVGEPAEPTADFEPEPVEAEVEDEEDSSRDEERARKQHAFDALRKIEKEFHAFREKHINDQLRQVNLELDLLRQPESTHPEYLAQLQCINARRDEKIRYENVKYKYDKQAISNKTVAERTQLHSQYFQEVRETRNRWIEQCYSDLHALQKDRRQWGAHQTNYNYLYNPKRAHLVQQQAAYNMEVSILSGIAKHVGFPAAPDLSSMDADDIDADFRAMAIPERPPQPQRIHLRDIERSSAGRDFFEQNAWANPSVAQAMASSQRFVTPTANHAATGIDMLMMSAPAPFSRNQTPSNHRPKSVTKLPGTMPRDTERIQTTHNSGIAGTTPSMGDAAEAVAPVFPTRHLERDEFFGRMGSSHPTVAPVGVVSGARYPP